MDDFMDGILARRGDETAEECSEWASGGGATETVLVVSHGIAIRSFVRGAIGASHDFVIHSDTPNTAITELMYEPATAPDKAQLGGWRLMRLSDAAHLQ
jgi:broad specificity phosphatase PhoE